MCTNVLNQKPRKFAYFLTHRVLQDWFWSNLDFNCILFKQHNIFGGSTNACIENDYISTSGKAPKVCINMIKPIS